MVNERPNAQATHAALKKFDELGETAHLVLLVSVCRDADGTLRADISYGCDAPDTMGGLPGRRQPSEREFAVLRGFADRVMNDSAALAKSVGLAMEPKQAAPRDGGVDG